MANMVNITKLQDGVRHDWAESFQMLHTVGLAIDAYEMCEDKKRAGYSEDLISDIEKRDDAVRSAAKAIMEYSKKHGILTRPINMSSFHDCMKAIYSLGDNISSIAARLQ